MEFTPDKFTEKAAKALSATIAAARSNGHLTVHPGHLILGLLKRFKRLVQSDSR